LNLFDLTDNRKQWEGRAGAAVSASMGLAKLHSLLTDKHKHMGLGGEPIAPVLYVTVCGGSNWATPWLFYGQRARKWFLF
jgi:hypothetical protein